MPRPTTYCQVSDLLLGDIPTSQYTTPAKFVDDAADEIDTYLGSRYAVPITVVTSGLGVPASLLLKRLNSHLASGRLLMAASASDENREVHAYAASLVKNALLILESIASGSMDLKDIAPLANSRIDLNTGPLVSNVDPVSRVEEFYGNFPVHQPARYLGLTYFG